MTLKPPKVNAPATITISMAESAVSAVQPATFKPVPARSKSMKSSSSCGMSQGGGFLSKKGSNSSPSSSRSSSRNSSLSPRERSGSMSNKGSNSSQHSPKFSSNSSSSGGGSLTSSPKSGQGSAKKKSSNNSGYDPKAPLIGWHVRNNCTPKSCNGWHWEGDGKIQKVHLNVVMCNIWVVELLENHISVVHPKVKPN